MRSGGGDSTRHTRCDQGSSKGVFQFEVNRCHKLSWVKPDERKGTKRGVERMTIKTMEGFFDKWDLRNRVSGEDLVGYDSENRT